MSAGKRVAIVSNVYYFYFSYLLFLYINISINQEQSGECINSLSTRDENS